MFPEKKINFLVNTISRIRFTIPVIIVVLTNPSIISQPNTELLKTQAEQHMHEGKFGEAIKLLNRFISSNPQDAAGYNLRGLCYENRKDYEMTVYDMRSAVKLDQKNKTYKENLDRAVKSWETILQNKITGFKRELKINPDNPQNYLEIGKCYKNLGRWTEAEEWYDEYLKRAEPSPDELLRYTEILAKNNHISKGEPLLKKYSEKYPDDHRLWSRYGYFTMWLGKKQVAIKSFEKALELRPYFKEALDGYDLARGKGYVYVVNDTTTGFNYGLPVSNPRSEYPIDKYYRTLNKNPFDNNTRVKLTNELIAHNRFYEAEEQINFLSRSEDYSETAIELEESLNRNKDIYYSKQISDLKNVVSQAPYDKKSNLKLSELYAEKKDYDSSIIILENLFVEYPDDQEVRYKLALSYLNSGELDKAYNEAEKLVTDYSDNINYQLLYGQVSTWLYKNPELAQFYLDQVLVKDPDNFSSLSSLTLLSIQNNRLNDAEQYLSKLSKINSGDSEVIKLRQMFEAQQEANRDAEVYKLVEQGREHLKNKECEKAIEKFQLYLSNENANQIVRKELAEAYLCKGDYQNAISIYNNLLIESPNDYSVTKQRAKVYFWSENYSKALDEFIKLNRFNPDDAEVKLYLGDSYTAVKDYQNARKIYEELLISSSSSHLINQRLKWIESPSAGSGFPVYTMLTPDFNYFTDNFDFLYSTYGLRLDIGITDYLTLGASAHAGVLGSDSMTSDISIYKGNIHSRISKIVSVSAGLGNTLFPDDENSLLAEISLKAEKQKVFSFSANFYSMDASLILYSPNLVDTRLRSNYFLLNGDYLNKYSWKFAGSYAFITVSDDNDANRLVLRFGKVFEKVFGIGYEYYYFDFKNQSSLYWSPENYESHSIWADWEAAGGPDVTVNIGGRLGYIPSDEFILREFYGTATLKLIDSFSIQGRMTFSTTAQSGQGYTSTSFGLSAFWSL